MRQLLYALLLDRGEAEDALAELGVDLDKGVVAGATIDESPPGKLVIVRDGSSSEVVIHPGVDESRDALLVSGSAENPEQLGLSWDVLVLLSLLRGGDIWLSTYTVADLRHLGPVHTLTLRGERGRVLSAEQFNRMLDAPGRQQ